MTTNAIPLIDPSVRYVGVSKLRGLNAAKLRDTKETLVFQDNDVPLAVLLSYENYLGIQQHLAALLSTLELFSDKVELEGVLRGLKEIGEGSIHSFDEVKATLKERYAKTGKDQT
jgi:hypothetical protein